MTIQISNLSFSYHGEPVLENVNATIKDKDFIAIVGPNGSGKTTLMKLILGLLPMQKGSIKLFGKSVSKFADWKQVGYVPQQSHISAQFPGTVRELLLVRPNVDIDALCEQLDIRDLLDKKFTELSGGQKQRILITMAMCADPKLLILDEPTVGVDMDSEKEFYDLLKHVNEDHGVTILLVTHEVGVIPKVAKSVLCINRQVCCFGPATKTHSLVKKIYKHGKVHEHGLRYT